jgi:hypothetical protein
MKTTWIITVLAVATASRAQSQPKPQGDGEKAEAPCKKSDTVCNSIKATRQLLADYQKAIAGQISAQQKSYVKVGQAAEQGRRNEVEDGLANERLRRAELITDDFITFHRPITHWKEYLRDYAALDFKSNRELLELDTLDGSRFLQGVQDLKADFEQVQALDKALAALEKKKSPWEALKDFGAMAKDTKDEFDKLVCAGLNTDLQAKQTAKTAADAANDTVKSAALKAAIDTITTEQKNKGCTN